MAAAVLVATADIDVQSDLAARPRGEAVGDRDEVAGDEGEEITWLRVRVDPTSPVASLPRIAGAVRITVRKQYRHARLVRSNRHRVARHHVRPVGEEGDATEA